MKSVKVPEHLGMVQCVVVHIVRGRVDFPGREDKAPLKSPQNNGRSLEEKSEIHHPDPVEGDEQWVRETKGDHAVSLKKRTTRTTKRPSDARIAKVQTRKQMLTEAMELKTVAIALEVSKRVREDIGKAVRDELNARGYLPVGKEDREAGGPDPGVPPETDRQPDPPTQDPPSPENLSGEISRQCSCPPKGKLCPKCSLLCDYHCASCVGSDVDAGWFCNLCGYVD